MRPPGRRATSRGAPSSWSWRPRTRPSTRRRPHSCRRSIRARSSSTCPVPRALDALEPVARLRPDCRVGALHPLQTLPSADAGLARPPGLVGRGGRAAGRVRSSPRSSACVPSGSTTPIARCTTPPRPSPRTTWSRCSVRSNGSPQAARVPFDAFVPLAQASLDNAVALGPAAALTGPVARGDLVTVARHLDALPASERDAYAAVAELAAPPRTARRRGSSPAALHDAGGRHGWSEHRDRRRAHRRSPCALRRRAPSRPVGRSRPDDGVLPRRPPLADARGTRRRRLRRGEPVRQPAAVRPDRGSRRLPARPRRRRGRRRGRGRRRPVRAAGRGDVPRADPACGRSSTSRSSPRTCAGHRGRPTSTA